MVILTVNTRNDSGFPLMSPQDGALSAHLAKSRFASRLIESKPFLAPQLDAQGGNPFSVAEIKSAFDGIEQADEATARRQVRQLRQRVLLRVMARDLAGV